MSAIPGNINVVFTAKTVGSHRVCYRVGSSGAYTCVLTTCESLGECTASIPIFVDNETCAQVNYTGYVQAACQAEISSEGRIAFSGSFTPTPSCKSYVATCARLGISSVTITSGGSGYNPSVPPIVTFIGDGDATGVAVVGQGGISNAVITNAGSGYANGTYTNVLVVGGTGTGAKASVTVAGGVVTSIVITSAGTGYTTSVNYNLNSADMGGAPAVEALFNVTTDYGKVKSITVTNITAYTSLPTVVIAPGTTTATGTVVMADCPEIDTNACSGDSVTIAAGALELGGEIVLCGYSEPGLDLAYDVAPSAGNCLCNCVTATLGVDGPVGHTVRYFYNKCNLEERSGILTVGGSPSAITDCIVPGSLVWQILANDTEGTVEYGDDCP